MIYLIPMVGLLKVRALLSTLLPFLPSQNGEKEEPNKWIVELFKILFNLCSLAGLASKEGSGKPFFPFSTLGTSEV
jgi:hypothetical protein